MREALRHQLVESPGREAVVDARQCGLGGREFGVECDRRRILRACQLQRAGAFRRLACGEPLEDLIQPLGSDKAVLGFLILRSDREC